MPNSVHELTQVFLNTVNFDTGQSWGWESWYLVSDEMGQASWVESYNKKLYCFLLVDMIRNSGINIEKEISAIDFKFHDDHSFKEDGRLRKLVDEVLSSEVWNQFIY